jgi:hypothetical protein
MIPCPGVKREILRSFSQAHIVAAVVTGRREDAVALNDGNRPGNSLADIGRFGGYGLTLGIATALFAWIGSILDERFRTGPLFVILGTFTGFGAGFYSMYRHLVTDRSGQDGNEDEPTTSRDRPG